MELITKTTLKNDCDLASYHLIKHPELKRLLSDEERSMINKGIYVGKIARSLYPGGLDMTENNSKWGMQVVTETAKALENNVSVLYEAAFFSPLDSTMFQADILLNDEYSMTLIEVKSGTGITLDEIKDAAIQYFTLSNCNLGKEISCKIAYLNKEYMLENTVDLKKLFIIEDVTDKVLLIQNEISNKVKSLTNSLTKSLAPIVATGAHCFKSKCQFLDFCVPSITKTSPYNLGGLSKLKAEKFIKAGYQDIRSIPNELLSKRQQIEVLSAQVGKPVVQLNKLQNKLTQLNLYAPVIHYLDFESYQLPIPQLKKLAVWQQVCFQYTLITENNGKISTREFLADPDIDPRIPFIESLITDTKGQAPVVVYNKAFEVTRMKDLMLIGQKYKSQLQNIIERCVDLLEVFSSRYFWNAEAMAGSASIKKVLPALTDLSYDDLVIKNGSQAMAVYEAMKSMNEEEKEVARSQLKSYCHRDVDSMRILKNKLIEIVQNKNTTKYHFI